MEAVKKHSIREMPASQSCRNGRVRPENFQEHPGEPILLVMVEARQPYQRYNLSAPNTCEMNMAQSYFKFFLKLLMSSRTEINLGQMTSSQFHLY